MTDKTTHNADTTTNGTTQDHTDTAQAPRTVPVATKPRRIRKPMQTASTAQDLPSHAALSFVKGSMGPTGFTPSSFFAVPDEEWYAGRITGVLAFQELQHWMKAEGFDRSWFRAQLVMEDAIKASNSGHHALPSKRGAANTFLHCAFQFMASAAVNDDGQWVVREIARQRELQKLAEEERAEKRAAFIERMQAKRAAKRAAQVAQAPVTILREAEGYVPDVDAAIATPPTEKEFATVQATFALRGHQLTQGGDRPDGQRDYLLNCRDGARYMAKWPQVLILLEQIQGRIEQIQGGPHG